MEPLNPDRIREQSARLHRLASAIVGQSHADDVLQDVWVAALDGAQVAPERSQAWLARVTRNLAWRKRIGDSRRRAREEQSAKCEASESSEAIVVRIEEGHLVERMLLDLDEPYRRTLLLRYYDDLSIGEISRRSGQPESTTRTHLQRGLERLRERMKSEQGPEWRMALLPFLRKKPAAPIGASAASALLGGSLMMLLAKSALVSVSALALWTLIDGAHEPPSIVGALAETVVPSSVELPSLPVAPAASEVATSELAEDPAIRQDAAPQLAVQVGLPHSTRAQVLDPTSKAPVPGLRVRVNRADQEHVFVTDDKGQIELPFAMTELAPHSTNRIRVRFEALVSGPSEHAIPLSQREGDKAGALDLLLNEAFTVWVRLPFAPEEAAMKTMTATSKEQFADERTLVRFERYAPVLVRGDDLLFIIRRERSVDSHGPPVQSRVLEMSLDAHRGFAVQLPPNVSLADPPYLAEVQPLVTQHVLVRSSLTGQPVPGAFVSLRERDRPNSKPVVLANGVTGQDGRLSLPTVRPGSLLAIVNATGFDLTFHDVEVTGGPTVLDLALAEPGGKSALQVIVRLKRGALPGFLAVTLLSGSPENVVGSQRLTTTLDGNGGWIATGDFEGLPPGKCRVHVNSDLPGLGTQEPYSIELPLERFELDLAPPPTTRSLVLKLPGGVRTIDFWIESESGRQMQLISGSASDGAQLATLMESRPPRNWLITSEGYLPLTGTEQAWKRHTLANGDPAFLLAPKLQPGSGVIVQITNQMKPIAGAHLIDPQTNLELATSDARGFAVLPDMSEGDDVRAKAPGFQARDVQLNSGPFTQIDLPTTDK